MFIPSKVAQEIISSTDLTNPDEIAHEIFDRTPESALADAYLLSLRTVARAAIRYVNTKAATPPKPATESTPRPSLNRSSKVAAIREHHLTYFDQRVHAQGVWKLLGDCTVDDLNDLADTRQAQADANAAKAREYRKLAERMQAEGVTTARELGAKAVAA